MGFKITAGEWEWGGEMGRGHNTKCVYGRDSKGSGGRGEDCSLKKDQKKNWSS